MTATLCARASFKVLIWQGNIPSHPDPELPILNTRGSPAAMGQGRAIYYRTTAAPNSGRGHGRGYFTEKSKACAVYYRTTAKTPHTRMRARARLRMHGIIHFSGSTVVDTSKSLAQNAKSPYRSPYRGPYRCRVSGRGFGKPLNSLNKGGI